MEFRGVTAIATILVGLVIGIGGLLLSALFTPRPKNTYGSRLSDINVAAVSPGNIIPRVWGTMKVNCQIIFASPLIETMHTHQASKKGGGKGSLFGNNSAKSYTFTYSVDVAFSVCAGPVYQIQRIYANQKLLWVNPLQVAHEQADFDAAYQAEGARLIGQEGVAVDFAAGSAFVFAWNNYNTGEVTLSSPSDAVAYCVSHPIDVDGTYYTPDTPGVTAVISQLYSALNNQLQYQATINRFDNLEIYQGDEFQIPNGLLQGYLSATNQTTEAVSGPDESNVSGGNAIAFRGCCYFVLTNLQLMDFGNSLPQFSAVVQFSPSGTTSLPEIIADVLIESGMTTDQFDCVSNVSATPFGGYCVTANTSPRQILEDLTQCFGINCAETGGILLFGQANALPNVQVDRDDYGAHVDTDALPTSEEVTRVTDYDLPYRINFSFQEPARNYSKNMVYAQRTNTKSQVVEDVEFTIGLDREMAQSCVQTLLMNRMFARRTYKVMLPRKYIQLDPTDIIRVQSVDQPSGYPNYYEDQYCTSVTVGANGIIEAEFIDHFYLDPAFNPHEQYATDIGVDSGDDDTLPKTSTTMPFLFDCPFLLDNDTDGPGFYVMMTGAFNGWQGGSLYVNTAANSIAKAYGFDSVTSPSGSNWQAIAASSINVPFGTALDALAPNMTSSVWDRVSKIHVFINNGMQLVSATEDDILTQPLNATIIGNEVVQYANATSLGNNLWLIDTFLRGLRNTDYYMNFHTGNENFIRLAPSLTRIKTTKNDLNVPNTFVAQSYSAPANSSQAEFSFTDTGNSLRPPPVYVTSIFRNVNGSIVVNFVPRVRQNGGWNNDDDVIIPANDTPETYSVDVYAAVSLTGYTGEPTAPTSDGTVDFPELFELEYPDGLGSHGIAMPLKDIQPSNLSGIFTDDNFGSLNRVIATYTISGSLGGQFYYTNGQQTTDFGSPQNPIWIAIYQVSNVVGRGYGIGVRV